MADGHITWRHAAARGARGEKVCVYGVGRTGTKNATRRIPRMSAGGSSNTEPSLDSGVCGLTRNREDRLFEGEFVEFSILLEPHKPASPSILEHDKEGKVPLYHPALSA
ncbi:hypothetical protein KCU63_g34, partial [Aureobasidium melanogenum]